MFMLTVGYAVARRKSAKPRYFAQEAIPQLWTWTQLEDLILTACLKVNRDQWRYQPTMFHVLGREMSLQDYLNRRPWKEANMVLTLAVKLDPNPDHPTVEVMQVINFDTSLQDIRQDMDLMYGRPLLPAAQLDGPHVPRWIRDNEPIDPKKYQRTPEPPIDGYMTAEPSGLPRDEPYPYRISPMEMEQRTIEEIRAMRGRRVPREAF